MKDYINIPMDRVGSVIGKNRDTLNRIEKETNTKINVIDNSVEIEGESIDIMDAKNIINAIGRGFNPKKAMKLLNENHSIEIIDLTVFDSPLNNIRSRLIGSEGKVRKELERLSKSYISVYGKTVSIIGTFENLKHASEAVNMIISGSRHSAVYKYLQSLHKE